MAVLHVAQLVVPIVAVAVQIEATVLRLCAHKPQRNAPKPAVSVNADNVCGRHHGESVAEHCLDRMRVEGSEGNRRLEAVVLLVKAVQKTSVQQAVAAIKQNFYENAAGNCISNLRNVTCGCAIATGAARITPSAAATAVGGRLECQ